MVDEFPILFIAAALAEGRTVTTGLDELRVKESDRLAVMAAGLQAIGARVEESEDGLIIDGTKGSMARFINHSCAPNCEVRMVKVHGTPRMAVFAGENGIMTGEELTYDYNFDNFGTTKQPCYCGASNCRGTLSKRLNAAEQKKQAGMSRQAS